MKSVKGTQTEKNLLASFAGESQARMRYDYFAKQAKKEGYVQIQNVFLETALNEKEHAKRFFKFLEGGELEICGSYPAGVIGTTEENLKEAAAGEHHEQAEMYPEFARVAQEEGFFEIAAVFRNIALAEAQHEKRYVALRNNILEGKVFKKDEPVAWRCDNCGFVFTGNQPPEICPACDHSKDYFEVLAENW